MRLHVQFDLDFESLPTLSVDEALEAIRIEIMRWRPFVAMGARQEIVNPDPECPSVIGYWQLSEAL